MVTLVLLGITAFLWGVTPVFEKIALTKVDPLIAVTIRSAFVTAGLIVLTLILGKGEGLTKVDGKALLLLGASGLMAGILGMWSYYGALSMEATSKVVPIAASYPLVTAFLSVVILGEEITPARVVGTTLIVIGIWFVK